MSKNLQPVLAVCPHPSMIQYIVTDTVRVRICVDCWDYIPYGLIAKFMVSAKEIANEET